MTDKKRAIFSIFICPKLRCLLIILLFSSITKIAAIESDDMWLEITSPSEDLYEGQGAVIHVKWYSALDLNGFRSLQIEIPHFRNEGWKIYNKSIVKSDAKNAIGLPVSGRRWIGKVSNIRQDDRALSLVEFTFIAVPQIAGKLKLGDAMIEGFYQEPRQKRNKGKFRSQYPSYFNNNLFNRPDEIEQYTRLSTHLKLDDIHITSLPSEGRPHDFSGIVGSFSLFVHASPLEVKAGDPITYKVSFQNHPFPFLLNLPSLQGILAFSRQFKFPNTSPDKTIENGEAIYFRTIRPVSEEVNKIPSLRIAYFDPDKKKYEYVSSESIDIITHHSDKVSHQDFEFSHEMNHQIVPEKNETGIWTIETNPEGANIMKRGDVRFWLLLLPPFCYFVFRFVLSDYRLKKLYPVEYYKKHSYRIFQKEMQKVSSSEMNIERVLRNYLGNRFNMVSSAHSVQDLEKYLDSDLYQDLRSLYRSLEQLRFQNDGKPVAVDSALIKEVENIVQRIKGVDV